MENTKIEWADHTFNPWIGCTKVSAGCAHCYAEALMDKRYGRVKWGDSGTREVTSDANWRMPIRWNKQAETEGVSRRVFCASLADVFEDREELKPWRSALFDLIHETPWLIWLVLTKRPENIRRLTYEALASDPAIPEPHILEVESFANLFPNVWLGTSVEDQDAAEHRIPELLKCRDMADVLFLSCEPLLGFVSIKPWARKIDWVIIGGESGPGARRCKVEWIYHLVVNSLDYQARPFVKQLGANPFMGDQPLMLNDRSKGGNIHEFPDKLKFRFVPKITLSGAVG